MAADYIISLPRLEVWKVAAQAVFAEIRLVLSQEEKKVQFKLKLSVK